MKKIGAITIGQAPRTDISADIESLISPDIELIQAGALDGMTLEEVQAYRPDGIGNTLVSRMRDGTGVTLEEKKILPLIQKRITQLEEEGVSAILIMCTGEFPDVFVSHVPVIYPSKVICNIIASLNGINTIGVITPEAEQIPDIERKWSRIFTNVVCAVWNPYFEKNSIDDVSKLKSQNVDIAVMDCFGYSSEMCRYASEYIGKPVILSRTLAFRVLMELI